MATIHPKTTQDIGTLIRRSRKAQGLRQDELAGVANVGTRFVVDLEAGKPTVQLEKTLFVLAALGIGLDLTSPPGLDPLPTTDPKPKRARRPR